MGANNRAGGADNSHAATIWVFLGAILITIAALGALAITALNLPA